MNSIIKDQLTAAVLSLIAGLIVYALMKQHSADLFKREAAERHGQSGAIGGGWGNAGRD